MTVEELLALLASDTGYIRLRGAVSSRPDEIGVILRDSELWFSAVSEQDDIFEGRPRVVWQECVDEEDLYDLARGQMVGAGDHACRSVAREIYQRLQIPAVIEDVRARISAHVMGLYQNSGICCFFSEFQNQRSWAEYASRGAGYGLVFDFSVPWRFEPGLGAGVMDMVPFPVTYVDGERPLVELSLAPADRADSFRDIEKALLTKSSVWRGQNECRLLRVGIGSGPVRFPEASLVAIILGYRISQEDEEIIRLHVAAHRPDLALFRIGLSDAGYDLALQRA